jgi:hypothetical protein
MRAIASACPHVTLPVGTALLALLLCAAPLRLPAQEAPQQPGSQQEAPEQQQGSQQGSQQEAPEQQANEQEAPEADSAEDSLSREADSAEDPLSREAVLRRDIQTASFGELVAWAERLGLSTRGSAQELRGRLADHFEITITPESDTEQEPDTEEGGTRTVVIESAEQTRYFTLDDISEDYVRLRGGVTLRLEEGGTGTVHHITADEVVFNRTRNLLSARGNVEYRIEREDGEELFRGQSLNFFIDSWDGTFLRGSSTRTQTVDDEELEFTYTGEYITRSTDDTVVMESGQITSSTAEPPYYHIAADRIWIFGPGEWGLRSATLYLGRVPVFYFPFFFRPGDELFFHPALGYRDREGTYLQTTTYLIGRQEPEDEASISFLQSDESDADSPRVREGLFLTRPEEGEAVPEPSENTLKLLADVYTRLGAYTGLEGDFSGGDVVDSLDLSVGFGASRTLFPAPFEPSLFSPYRVESGEGETHWDTTSFLGFVTPLRYKVDLQSSVSGANAGISGEFELYSDPFVNRDFLARQENIRWLELLRGERDTAQTGQATTKSSLLWRLTGNGSLRPEGLAPYVERLSLDRAEVSLGWASREVTDLSSLPSHLLSADGTAVVADQNPASEFFFPDTLVLPLVNASATGTLFSTDEEWRDANRNRRKASEEADQENQDAEEPDQGSDQNDGQEQDREPSEEDVEERQPLPEPRPPWQQPKDPGEDGSGAGTESGAEAGDAAERYKDPAEILGTLSGISLVEPIGTTVSYRLDPELRLDYPFADEEWSEPSDVSFDTRFSRLTSTNDAQLTYRFDFFGGLLDWRANLDASAQYRSLSDISSALSETEIEQNKKDARTFTSSELNHDLQLTGYPLRSTTRFSDSRIEYRFNTRLFARQYEEERYENLWPDWDEESISRHSLSSTLAVELWRSQQRLSLSTSLPPRQPSVDGSLNLTTGPVSSTLSASANRPENEGEWIFNPAQLQQTLTVNDEVSLRHTTRYGIEEERFESVQGSLNAYIFSASYRMGQSRNLVFEPDFQAMDLDSPWVEKGSERLRPDELTTSIAFDQASDPLWKNRLVLDGGINTRLTMDLQEFTRSSLELTFELGLDLHEFMDLSFSSTTANNRVYLYVPSMADTVNREPRNVVTDLVDSFRFGDTTARRTSNFNLQSISLNLVHHLGDWDLTARYSGRPTVVDENGTGQQRYEWTPEFELVVEWRPVTELRSEIQLTDEELTFVESDGDT